MIRTRFAPSPTGFLHVGGLRTALYNYIFAKQHKGKFILRIEDTDQNRKVNHADHKIIESLEYFGIEFDEGPNKNEEYGPYLQSERLDIYKKHYIELIKTKKAYVCFEEDTKLIPEYDVGIALEKIKQHSFVVKFSIDSNIVLEINDELRGSIAFDLGLIDDPIIIKSDGFPTYHFANVIDDHYMKISHVIRGEEWISSLPKHVLLYKSFGWELPKFVHLPLLLNPDKSKLSKRQGDVNVENFIDKGYLKTAIINFISLLGWHPSGDDELFDLNYLIKNFSLNRIHKAGAIFDLKKLNWMNSIYIKNCQTADLYDDLLRLSLLDSSIDIPKYYRAIDYAKNSVSTIFELHEKVDIFFNNSLNKSLLLDYQVNLLFEFWINHLKAIDIVSLDNINNIIQLSKEKLNISGKNLFIPLRLVLIGKEHGPDLFTIIDILGIDESIHRINLILK